MVEITSLAHANRPSVPALLGLALVVVAGAACNRQEVAPVLDIVARIDNAVITVRDVEAELSRRARSSAGPMVAANRDAVLEEMIRHEVLLARAKAAGYEHDPDVRRQIERLIVTRFEAATQPDFDRLPSPTAEEIKRSYTDRLPEFTAPEKIRVSLILLRGSPKATTERQAALRTKAERLRQDIVGGGQDKFAELAQQHSDDRASRYSGGDVGWIEPHAKGLSWPPAVINAMLSLTEPGALSPVIAVDSDIYLLRFVDRVPAAARPLTEVSPQIVHRLIRERRAAAEQGFYARQRDGLHIEVDRAALQRASAPPAPELATAHLPPALPAR